MDSGSPPARLGWFLRYYALLQLFHLTFLIRAGFIYLSSNQIPFPAQPPAGGWQSQTIPFLIALGALDAIAAGLALFAGWRLIFGSVFSPDIWMISISIALTSAVIYCIGTLPSGAWGTNPLGYGIVVILFSPLTILGLDLWKFWIRLPRK